MKQIIQHLNSGETALVEVPMPMVQEGHLLIRSHASLVSAGTEKMLVDFGRANWINKARMQPERVRTVLNKIKTDGLRPTIDAVKSKLGRPIPLGYSNAGVVMAVGANVRGFQVGDRVVSNGAHAEVVNVPQNLCAHIPDQVTDEEAAFTVVGAIALQGIRLIGPAFGETVVVIGLGLIGQIAIQLLQANGCRVIGVDPDPARCDMAASVGVQACCNEHAGALPEQLASVTAPYGADAVLITASTKDNNLISEAAQICRKRGRIVLVGAVGLHLNRSDFYEKEISFQVSCSYGPGRYDYTYEKQSHDYPVAFVRWTAQRNFEAVLQAMTAGQLKVGPLITGKIALDHFQQVYHNLGEKESLASVFLYDTRIQHSHTLTQEVKATRGPHGLALIGAGNFAHKVVAPALRKHALPLLTIASANGLSAAQLAKQYAIPRVTTDLDSIWNDPAIDTVIIATRHNEHAAQCIRGLASGKHVFVEKPLALSMDELDAVSGAVAEYNRIIDVGFNRRHAPLALRMKQLLKGSGPLNIVITVNAGTLPPDNWLSDDSVSGGRIIGEVCHFIDLAAFLCAAPAKAVCANMMQHDEENVSLLIRFTDGSSAVINYFNNGSKAYDKERIEVYAGGKTVVLENWKKLSGFGFTGFSSVSAVQDKGHHNQFRLLGQRMKQGGGALIPFASIYNTSACAIAAVQSLKEQIWVSIPLPEAGT